MAFLPEMVKEALATDDIVQQVKICTAFASSTYHNSILWRNPLSGLLGETASFKIGEDCEITVEQISMKPSTILIYGKGPGYVLQGYLNDTLQIGAGGAVISNTGDICVTLENTGATIYVNPSKIVVSGLVGKNKKFKVEGDTLVYCKEEGIVGQMTFCPEKKSMFGFMSATPDQDKVQGTLYKVPEDVMEHIVSQKIPRTLPKLQDGMDGVSVIGEISGLWTSKLDIAG